MAIVLDNSMLNSQTFSIYRNWLLRHYILRAVIGLPKYSFIQAGAGGVTSILYLEKRKDTDQHQPPVFARDVMFTGLSKSGKEISENDLPDVLSEWREFERTGKLFFQGKSLIGESESDSLFLIRPEDLLDRIDVAYHVPSFRRAVARIDKMGIAGTHDIKTVSDFRLAERIESDSENQEIFKYIDIGAIDGERCRIVYSELEEGSIEELSDRARNIVRENDVLLPLSYDSLGKVAIVPKELDGHLASTGLLVIRNDSYEEALMLWAIARSEVMQMQFRHISSGYTQRGLSREHLPQIRFPFPRTGRPELIAAIKERLGKADESRTSELAALSGITESVMACLGSGAE